MNTLLREGEIMKTKDFLLGSVVYLFILFIVSCTHELSMNQWMAIIVLSLTPIVFVEYMDLKLKKIDKQIKKVNELIG